MPNLGFNLLIVAGAVIVIGLSFHFYGKAKYAAGKAAGIEQIKNEIEEGNKKIAKSKKNARKVTQTGDRDYLVRMWCDSGRVRNPDKCPH